MKSKHIADSIMNHTIDRGGLSLPDLVRTIDVALAAERERCAALCDDLARNDCSASYAAARIRALDDPANITNRTIR